MSKSWICTYLDCKFVVTKYLSPPAHQIWVTHPLQAGTAAGTSFMKSVPNASAAPVRRARNHWRLYWYIGSIFASSTSGAAIDRHLTTKHNPNIRWYSMCPSPHLHAKEVRFQRRELRFGRPQDGMTSLHWLWMNHSEIVRHKKCRPRISTTLKISLTKIQGAFSYHITEDGAHVTTCLAISDLSFSQEISHRVPPCLSLLISVARISSLRKSIHADTLPNHDTCIILSK